MCGDFSGILGGLGPEGRRHFFEAMKKGSMKIARVNLDMLGDGRAGKSSLGDSLMDEPFIKGRKSTEGAEMLYIQTGTGHSTKWKRDDRSNSLGCLLARGLVLALDTIATQSRVVEDDKGAIGTSSVAVKDLKSEESSQILSEDKQVAFGQKAKDKLTEKRTMAIKSLQDDADGLQNRALSGTEGSEGGTSTPSGIGEDLESGSSMSEREESSQVVDFGQKEFQKAKHLLERQIRLSQDDLENQDSFIHISVCDRGGQELYLPIHMALIANCSEFIPKAYLLVFDLNKPLSEDAAATFQAQEGAKEITYPRCRKMKNEEIIGGWASAVDLAHPESDMHAGTSEHAQKRHRRLYLGQEKAPLRGPVMFVIGTHYDEVLKRGEERQEFVKQQEEAVKKVLEKHKYIERVVSADENNRIFKIDNKKSGTGIPDPMVNTLRKLIFDMAVVYREKMPATPLPYIVLERGLLNMSQPEEPGSACDSDRMIMNMKDVVHLAQQYCDLKGQGPCQTALRYLSSVGAIFYFFKAAGLKDKVFTDPQWVFNVMSTFVTILKVPLEYSYQLNEFKRKGLMSRELAEHLLERRELGVKAEHYNTIFRLLQLVDVFCPAVSYESPGRLAVETAKQFYVPCMLEVDFEEQTAWEQSSAAGSSDSTCCPPSLIFKPTNVDLFPEPLFFRLSSRTAYQFPEFPQLKRNRIQVYFDESHLKLKLELLYHSTRQYVIATISPIHHEELPTPEVVNRQCIYVRRFLCWQLNDAKRNGMDGFQYELYFQVAKEPHTMDVKKELLYPLPKCDKRPHTIIHPSTHERLKGEDCLSVKAWYASDRSECGRDYLDDSIMVGLF